MIEAIRNCIPSHHKIEFVQGDELIAEVSTSHGLLVAQEKLLQEIDGWLLAANDTEMLIDSPYGALRIIAVS